MSVSIKEVLESAGYDISHNKADAQWLLSQQDEFESLCDEAEEYIDNCEEDEDYE